MDKPNYVLLNNNKPATHFIEVFKSRLGELSQTTNTPISFLDFTLKETIELKAKTIAIFKIRLK